jgi:S1 RNA binding domain protein
MPTEQTNIEPGQILEGRVQGITTFGAFIELPGGEVGLVHISEIADTYVKDIKDFIREGDTVGVKVLSVAGKKIGLSIKQAAPPKEEKT